MDETELRDMKKGINLKMGVERYKQVTATFHRHGIGVIGSFIIGSSHESREYYEQLSRFMFHSGID
jgi:radical SAM superfamily enzyme